MKLARFKVEGRVRHGVVQGNRVKEIQGSIYRKFTYTGNTYPLSRVKLMAPTVPVHFMAGGANYPDHLAQADATSGRPGAGQSIRPWSKGSLDTVCGYDDPIIIPPEAKEVHWEAELVIVIGRQCHRVSPEEAEKHILGYTCGNDVSEKSAWEGEFSNWRAKGMTNWGPVGPWVATGIDPTKLKGTLRINGKVEHQWDCGEMIHSCPSIVSFISTYYTLHPGDLILTGASGVTTPMHVGDVVEVEISEIGTLRNPVVAEKV